MKPKTHKAREESAPPGNIQLPEKSPAIKDVLYSTEWALHDDCVCQMGPDTDFPAQSTNEAEVLSSLGPEGRNKSA